METPTEKDISIVQDSKIAIQVINKAMALGKGLNFFYIDNRRAEATDNRCVTCGGDREQELTAYDHKKMIPNVAPSRTGSIPEHLKDDLEQLMEKFPEPKLDHMIKAMFEIAFKYGPTSRERGRWLGIGRGKMHYWTRKLKLNNS